MRAVVALLLLAIVSVCFADSVTFARKHTELIQIHSHLSKLEIRLTKEVSVAKRIVQRKREAHRRALRVVSVARRNYERAQKIYESRVSELKAATVEIERSQKRLTITKIRLQKTKFALDRALKQVTRSKAEYEFTVKSVKRQTKIINSEITVIRKLRAMIKSDK